MISATSLLQVQIYSRRREMKLMKHNYLQQNIPFWVSEDVFVCFPLQIHDETSIYRSDADSSVWKGEPVFSSVI